MKNKISKIGLIIFIISVLPEVDADPVFMALAILAAFLYINFGDE